MRRILSVAFVASAMFAGALFAAELKSGLQPGDAPPPYNVKLRRISRPVGAGARARRELASPPGSDPRSSPGRSP